MELTQSGDWINFGGGPTITFVEDQGKAFLVRVSNTVFDGTWKGLIEKDKIEQARDFLLWCLETNRTEDEKPNSTPLFILRDSIIKEWRGE